MHEAGSSNGTQFTTSILTLPASQKYGFFFMTIWAFGVKLTNVYAPFDTMFPAMVNLSPYFSTAFRLSGKAV